MTNVLLRDESITLSVPIKLPRRLAEGEYHLYATLVLPMGRLPTTFATLANAFSIGPDTTTAASAEDSANLLNSPFSTQMIAGKDDATSDLANDGQGLFV